MNKTININLAGIIFHLDENAYDAFKRYLSQVKDALLDQEGGAEVIADIEARIAELFQQKLEERGTEVVLLSDIEFVIATLGRPEEFADEEFMDEPASTKKKGQKRFFRNPDEKVIGGVASGIAAYFNIDPLWIRIAFLILLFTPGAGLPLYIILWIAIPEAKTTAQKLQMRGEPINLNNIEKSVKDELNGVKERFGNYRKRESNNANNLGNSISKFFDFLLSIFESILAFIIKFLGVIGIIIGSILAFSLIMALIGVSASTWSIGSWGLWNGTTFIGTEATEALFGSGWRLIALRVGSLLTLVFPIVGLTLLVGKLLGRTISNSKLLTGSSLVLLLVGLGMIITSGVSIAKEFKQSALEQRRINLDGTEFHLQADLLEDEVNFMFDVEDDLLRIEDILLDVQRSRDSTAYVSLTHFARGENTAAARSRAKEFEYGIEQVGETVNFAEYFAVPKSAMYRRQQLRVKVYLPVGAEIFLDASMENIIFDIDNVHDMRDDRMLGHTWKMTPRGLVCLDCMDSNFYSADDLEKGQQELENNLDSLEYEIEAKLEELNLELKKLKEQK